MSHFKFTVVGGGTAGWLTALYLQHFYPYVRIEVIASSEISILGAGEGTTPNVLSVLNMLGIPTEDLFKYANATVKNGIKFTDWNGDNTAYFHGFTNNNNFNPFYFEDVTGQSLPVIALEQIGLGKNLNDVVIDSHLSDNCRVKYVWNQSISNKLNSPMSHFNQMGTHAIHFDASMLAEYLKSIAIARGVQHFDEEVFDFKQDNSGRITKIVTNEKERDTSFVFDCSGFKRLIIGGLYQSEWISYKEHLPMDKAIGFFLPLDNEEEIPSMTESIAMKNGWVWKIPVQNRFGCGYVYDSDYIAEEEAKQEVIDKFGDVTFGKSFSFEAGCYKTPWVKNCIAIGLSSGFIEPLEATSIMISVMGLNSYLDNKLGSLDKNKFYVDRYNERMCSINAENMEFIYTHYLTKRCDSLFWKEFREKNPAPQRVTELLDVCKITMPDKLFLTDRRKVLVYDIPSWYSIMAGLGLFDKNIAIEFIDAIITDFRGEQLEIQRQQFKRNFTLNKDVFIKHSEFINYIKE